MVIKKSCTFVCTALFFISSAQYFQFAFHPVQLNTVLCIRSGEILFLFHNLLGGIHRLYDCADYVQADAAHKKKQLIPEMTGSAVCSKN